MPVTPFEASLSPTTERFSASSISRIAWVSKDCPPQSARPHKTRRLCMQAPHPTGLPHALDLDALDRFSLEPIHLCAARQHSLKRPYVLMHLACRTGPRHRALPADAPVPWLSLTMKPAPDALGLGAPSVGLSLHTTPSFGHIDSVSFFCVVGQEPKALWLGSLDDATQKVSTQIVITTMLAAERGEPAALLRASLMLARGLGVVRDTCAARHVAQGAYAAGATGIDAAVARASLIAARRLPWLAAALAPCAAHGALLAEHEAVHTLAYAARLGWLSGVLGLIEYGLCVDTAWPKDAAADVAHQPLHQALLGSEPIVLLALMRRSRLVLTPGADPSQTDALQAFARQAAAPHMVLALETFLAAPNQTGHIGRTADARALSRQNSEAFTALLNDFWVDTATGIKDNGLIDALLWGHKAVAEVLEAHGADDSPFYLAAPAEMTQAKGRL